MMASRSLDTLQPKVRAAAENVLENAEISNLSLLIYCTRRSMEEQARLYRKGRSLDEIKRKADELRDRWERPDLADLLMDVGPQYGVVVTHAGPGQSMHNYGLAFDAVPMLHGKPVWQITDRPSEEVWHLYGRIVNEAGLEWGGDWKHSDRPHAQERGARWRELILRGAG